MIRRVERLVTRFGGDEAGQDLIEWVLLTAGIAIAGLLVFGSISGKMAAAYNDWTGSPATGVQQVWEPCAPGAAPPC